jgi:hypothetical protein
MNLYSYEKREAIIRSQSKLDKLTGEYLPKNQKVFRHYDYSTKQTSYYYKTNEKLTGHCAKPCFIKKNYRLGTRSLNPLNLLNLSFFGYNLKLSTRTAKLEKKNGSEQKQINELKAKITQLEKNHA